MSDAEVKLQAFKNRAKELLEDFHEISEVYLIKSKVSDDWGVLYIDDSDGQNRLEDHCQQCFEEFYPFRFAGSEDFPYKQLSVTVSSKKFKALIDGVIKLPDTLELCELLEKR